MTATEIRTQFADIRENMAHLDRFLCEMEGTPTPPPPPCPECKGSGRVKEPVETYSYSEYDMCPKCKAKGHL